MPKSFFAGRTGNHLLDLIPVQEYRALEPLLHKTELEFKQVLYESRAPIEQFYFPTSAVLSAITVMKTAMRLKSPRLATKVRPGCRACHWPRALLIE